MGYSSNIKDLKKLIDEVKKECCETIGKFVVAESQTRTPVLTGNLRRGQTYQVMENNEGVTVGSNIPYDERVEFGDENYRGTPHWRPALDENKKEIEKIVKDTFSKLIGEGD